MDIKSQASLAEYTSWLVGGPGEHLCVPRTLEELREALVWAQQQKLPVTVFGGGTNILISDRGIKGLVLCLRRFSKLEVQEREGRLELTALAGTGKSDLLKTFLKYKLAPALFMAGVSGDVGGGGGGDAGGGGALRAW